MNLEHEQSTDWSKLSKKAFFTGIELVIFTALFAILSENIDQFSTTYLSELPVLGSIFELIDPETTPADIVAALLAFFIVSVPVYMWAYILSEKVLLDPQEWLSHPQNQIIASIAAVVLLLVVSLEGVNLYTLVVKQSSPAGGFVQLQQSGFISFVANNQFLAIAISGTLTIMNIVIALLTADAYLDRK